MQGFHHAPMLTVNVALRNWRFLDKLGISCARWFEGFGWWTGLRRNVIIDGKETMPLDPNKPVVLTQYNPFLLPGLPFPQQCTTARMQLFGMSYSEIEAAVRAQFTKMFSSAGFDAARDIAGITTNRWGHAYNAMNGELLDLCVTRLHGEYRCVLRPGGLLAPATKSQRALAILRKPVVLFS
jgi:spermidine dehydrogenase